MSDVQRFGKYEIIEELGRGGMGVVYKARDPVIGRLVALKTLSADSAADPDLLRRFEREAQAAGGLQHPNIVTIYDIGNAKGTPFIAMEFLEGESLEKIIARQEPLPLAQKVDILLQFCRGLSYAHKHGVIHRDIKPANILVKADGIVKIVDFGVVHMSTTAMTQAGVVIGTIPYMSPEQVSGQPIDQRSDIFAVGTVFYEFVTGTKPFDGPNLPSIMLKITQGRPAPPSQLLPDIPPLLEQAIMRCLEQQPNDRFQSLDELVLELEPLEQSLKREMVGELVGRGQALFDQKDYAKAKEVLHNVLVLDSGQDRAKDLMAKVITEMRRQEAASRVERLVGEGNQLLRQGKNAEAGRALEEALKLDSHHGQARALLEEVQKRTDREKLVREDLSAIQDALGTGNLTLAEEALSKLLELDAENHEARVFEERIKQARAHERSLRMQQALLLPRHLLIEGRNQEAVQQLEQLQQEFPGEVEIGELLEAAQRARAEQESRRAIEAEVSAVRKLISAQKFDESAARLIKLRERTAQNPEVAELYESAQQQFDSAVHEQQLSRELGSIQDLIRGEHYQTAVERAELLRNQNPDSNEVRRLLEFARGLYQTAEQQKEAARLRQEVQAMLDRGQYQEAVRAAEAAVQRFPDSRALGSLLDAARKGQAEEAARLEQEKVRQQIGQEISAIEKLLAVRDYTSALERIDGLDKQYPDRPEVRRVRNLVRSARSAAEKKQVAAYCQTIQAWLDAGEVQRACDEAERALHYFPGNVDIVALLIAARRAVSERAVPAATLPQPVGFPPNSAGLVQQPVLEDASATALFQPQNWDANQADGLPQGFGTGLSEDRGAKAQHEVSITLASGPSPARSLAVGETAAVTEAELPAPISSDEETADDFSYAGLLQRLRSQPKVAAAGAAALLVVVGVFAAVLAVRHRRSAEARRSVSPTAIQLNLETNPAGAAVRIDGQDEGQSPVHRALTPGTHQLEATKEGYQNLAQSFEVEPGGALPPAFTLKPLPLRLAISTSNLKDPQIQWDGRAAGGTTEGKWELDSVEQGQHTLEILVPGSTVGLGFETMPGSLPEISGKPMTKGVELVTVSSFGNQAHLQFSNFTPAKITLDGQSYELKPEGIDVTLLNIGPHTLAWLEADTTQATQQFESGPAPGLAVFVSPRLAPAARAKATPSQPQPSAQPAAIDPRASQIAQLTAQAHQAAANGSYAEPAGENAIDYANQILKLDGSNTYAAQIRDFSIKREEARINDELGSKHFNEADRMVTLLAELVPDDPKITDLQGQIKEDVQADERRRHPTAPPKPVLTAEVTYLVKPGKYSGTLTVVGQRLKFIPKSAVQGQPQLDISCSDVADVKAKGRVLNIGQKGFRVITKSGKIYEFESSDTSNDAVRSACGKG